MHNQKLTLPNHEKQAIMLVRPLLIIGIVITHFFFIGINWLDIYHFEKPFNALNFWIIASKRTLTLGAVPLLSLISGYLAIPTFSRLQQNYPKLISHKFKRLIIPLLVANLIFLTSKAVLTHFGYAMYYPEVSLTLWLKEIFAYKSMPAIPATYFLKDLFVCFLFLPIIQRLLKHKLTAFALLTYLLYLWITSNLEVIPGLNIYPFLFSRIDILLFFSFGAYLATCSYPILLINKKSLVLGIISSYLLFSVVITYLYITGPSDAFYFPILGKVNVAFGLLFALSVMHLLAYLPTNKLYRILAYLSPASFTIFIWHIPVQSYILPFMLEKLSIHAPAFKFNSLLGISFFLTQVCLMTIVPTLGYYLYQTIKPKKAKKPLK